MSSSDKPGSVAAPDPLLSSSGTTASDSPSIGMSNGSGQVNPSPSNSAQSRKRAASGDYSWLPPGWIVEEKVRTSGSSAGTMDKYYIELATGYKFRSRTEVNYYLEHGVRRSSKKAENYDSRSGHFEGQGSSRASRKANATPPPPPLDFDFQNPPECVSWQMAKLGEEPWTPFVNGEKVEDSVSQNWRNAFFAIMAHNPSKLSF